MGFIGSGRQAEVSECGAEMTTRGPRDCKRGHFVPDGKLCRECKRIRDREFARKNKKPVASLTKEEVERRREQSRKTYKLRAKDPEWRKKRAKKAHQDFMKRVKKDPGQLKKHKARMKSRWEKVKADSDKLEAAREQTRIASKKYRDRQFTRPDPAEIAKRVLAKAEARMRLEKMGLTVVATT